MFPSMFPYLRANETFVADTFFVSETQKKTFLIIFQNPFVSAKNVSPLTRRGMLAGFCGRVGCISKIEQ